MKSMLFIGFLTITTVSACNATSPSSSLEGASDDSQPRQRGFHIDGPTYNTTDINRQDDLYQKSRDEAGETAREWASADCKREDSVTTEVGLVCSKRFSTVGVYASCSFKYYCGPVLSTPPVNGPQSLSEACAFGTVLEIHTFYCQSHGYDDATQCANAIKNVSMKCMAAGNDFNSCVKMPYCRN